MALYARLEAGDFIGTGRMLQVVEGAAVGDRRDQRAELQRSHRDALAERAHLADAAEFGGDFFFRISAQLLARNAIAGEFAEPELVRIVLHLLEPELASDAFEVAVVRVRQALSDIHAAAASELDFSSLVDHAFAQCRQSNG